MKLVGFLICVIVSVCMFCSCQKEIADIVSGTDSTSGSTQDTTPVNNSFMVKTYTEDLYAVASPDQHVKDSIGLIYDSNKRLTKMASLDSANGVTFIYTYGNKLFTIDEYENNALSLHEILYLNNFSYVDSTVQDDQEGDTTTEKYIYNTSRQLLQVNEYSYTTAGGSVLSGTSVNTYDVNGNVSSTKTDDAITSYVYAKKTVNSLNIGLVYYQAPKYLPDSFTYITSADNQTGTHTYTFDSIGRLTEDKTELSNGYIAIKKYYY